MAPVWFGPETGVKDLSHHLVVEYKAIGIFMVVDLPEHLR